MLIENRNIATDRPAMPNGSPVVLLTPDETAAFLRVSRSTLYRLVARRVLRFYRISGVLRFAKSDVETFIARGVTEPVANDL